MTLVWRPGFQFDDDASTYIEAVEAADTQALETGVRYAINDFVIGCKNDGIWDAIKVSCILAGARTLNGALVPLVGTAPTNYNFVSGDYDRETGLVGDGSTKYLDSNRLRTADPRNSFHSAVAVSQLGTTSTVGFYISNGVEASSSATGLSVIGQNASNEIVARNTCTNPDTLGTASTGFVGTSRAEASKYTARSGGTDYTLNQTSENRPSTTTKLYTSRLQNGLPNAMTSSRIRFYSIGEALDLAALDTRVSALITAIGAAIP